jgi:hypothetical protein
MKQRSEGYVPSRLGSCREQREDPIERDHTTDSATPKGV